MPQFLVSNDINVAVIVVTISVGQNIKVRGDTERIQSVGRNRCRKRKWGWRYRINEGPGPRKGAAEGPFHPQT